VIEHLSQVRETRSREGDALLQTTLQDRVSLTGVGVHSGAPVTIHLLPADADQGIRFLRTGLPEGDERVIRASRDCVAATELCTVIAEPGGASVSTIEHLMAALVGMGVDNVTIEIDGPEVPILDGSSRLFVEAIDKVGVRTQRRSRRVLKILKTVRVEQGRCWAELGPSSGGYQMDVEIDFPTPVIGRQRRFAQVTPDVFRNEICGARTFGFMKDVEFLWKKNLALGASLENTVAIGEDRVINPEGLRHPDEFVRHKILDAIGDLSLAGAAIEGCYRAYCPGHRMNAAVLSALFADRSAYELRQAAPARASARHMETGIAAAVAYAPDKS
jgi:UDP-3-O-[3-hydroxymyristoyl] N-acetylglucosamine deacetylase